MKRSVLIVDDHPGFLEAARSLLEADGFDVIALASTGDEAVSQALRFRPDVVLLDVQLPGMDGFAVANILAHDCPTASVILTSSRSAATYSSKLAETSARGFVSKADLSGATLASFLT